MNEEISLVELLDIFKKNIGIIVKSVVACIVAAVIITLFFLTPKYEADTQMLVNNSSSEGGLNVGDIQTSLQMITTYKEFILGDAVLKPVAEEMGDGTTVNQLKTMTAVSNTQNSQIMTISVTSADPRFAVKAVNAIAKSFQKQNEERFGVDNLSVESEAGDAPQKVSSSILKNISIALVLGIGLAVAIIIIKEMLDTRIHSESDLQRLGFTILGSVNEMTAGEVKQTRFKRRKVSASKESTTVSRRRHV